MRCCLIVTTVDFIVDFTLVFAGRLILPNRISSRLFAVSPSSSARTRRIAHASVLYSHRRTEGRGVFHAEQHRSPNRTNPRWVSAGPKKAYEDRLTLTT
jgi:hypothetical protein